MRSHKYSKVRSLYVFPLLRPLARSGDVRCYDNYSVDRLLYVFVECGLR